MLPANSFAGPRSPAAGLLTTMSIETMRRQASDNVYLHQDFHGALSTGIDYLHRRYGSTAVREYLHAFADRYYAPVARELAERGLDALRDFFAAEYAREGGSVSFTEEPNALMMEIAACPVRTFLRKGGFTVAEMFTETDFAVWRAVCAGTLYAMEVLDYDANEGRARVRFVRRGPA